MDISLPPNISDYTLYATKDEIKSEDGMVLPGVKASFYKRSVEDREFSVGVFSNNLTNLYCAWGYADEEHCSYNSVWVGDKWSEPVQGCPSKRVFAEGNQTILLLESSAGQIKFILGYK